MRRWRCLCSYDGTSYFGWQTQDGQISIQQAIEEALEVVFKKRVSVHGSGRTDTGVHAEGQVFHFDFDWEHGPEKLRKAIGSRLSEDIQVYGIEEVDADFHARFSAIGKRYRYQFHLGAAGPFQCRYCYSVPEKMDLSAIRSAMDLLLGRHDFAAFAANRGIEYETTVRTITKAELNQDSEYVKLSFEADGFMYKMVRTLAGTLMNVGLARIGQDEIWRYLETGKRDAMAFVAPARGLFLEKVFY